MLISDYLSRVETSLAEGIRGMPLHHRRNQIEDLVAPTLVLKVADIGPSSVQDHMLVSMELELFWIGESGPLIATLLYSWAYRRLQQLREGPVTMTQGEYDAEVGANPWILGWDVVLENDYRSIEIQIAGVPVQFNPIEEGGVPITDIRIELDDIGAVVEID